MDPVWSFMGHPDTYNKSETHIISPNIMVFQFTSWHLMTFKGQIEVIEFLRDCITWIGHVMTKVFFKWNAYSKSYMIFHLTSWSLTLDDLQRSDRDNWVFSGLYLLNLACCHMNLWASPDGSAVWGVVVSTRWWLLVDHCVLRNWDRILVRAVKGLISRAGMVSICPLLWQRDVKLQQTKNHMNLCK